MKRIFSLMLAIMMLVSAIPTAFALEAYLCDDCSGYLASLCPDCAGEHTYCPTCDVCSACDDTTIPEVGTTTVTLVGSEEDAGSYYEVEVPAAMTPGTSADVVVTGNWKSIEVLTVTAPEKVTLYNGDQSIDVAIIDFAISQVGSDKEDCEATGTITLAPASVTFGTWTGVIEYTVELGPQTGHSGGDDI